MQLYVREGDRRVCVASLESPHGLRTIVPMGAVLPLDRGSAGRVLSASPPAPSPHALVGRRIAGDSPAEWVESVEEREAGVASVSAPVPATAGHVVAAVSVSGPVERTTRSPGARYGAPVAAAARRIEEAAGFTARS